MSAEDMLNQEGHALNAAKVIKKLRAREGTVPVVLTGKIVNGKVEIDQHVLDEIAKTYPTANAAFVAVNAPFDPRSID